MEDHTRFTTRALWTRLRNVTCERERYQLLQCLQGRLKNSTDLNSLITPEMVNCLSGLLADVHPASVKVSTLRVLRILCNNTDVRRVFLRQDIIKILATLLEGGDFVTPAESCSRLAILFYHEVTGLLVKLSLGNLANHKEVIEAETIEEVTQLCNPASSALFAYSEIGKNRLVHITRDKLLIGETSILPEEEMRVIYEDYLGSNYIKFRLPEVAHELDLYDTQDPNRDINIREDLEACGFVWPEPNKPGKIIEQSNDGGQRESSNWHDITVTQVIDTVSFWGLIGTEALSIIARVREVLKSWDGQCNMLQRQPKLGSFVVACHGDLGHFRAQVVAICDDDDFVQVFSLDYGMIITLPWNKLFLITADIVAGLKEFPPQVQLCVIKGCTPPPVDIDLMEQLASTLTLLVSVPDLTKQHFSKKHMKVLLNLCRCPESRLRRAAAEAIANVAHCPVLRGKVTALGTMETLLGGCWEVNGTLADAEATAACLLAISNLIHRQRENQQLFIQQHKGLPRILRLAIPGVPGVVRSAALKVLRVMMGNASFIVTEPQQSPERPHARLRSRSRGRAPERRRSRAADVPYVNSDLEKPQGEESECTANKSGEMECSKSDNFRNSEQSQRSERHESRETSHHSNERHQSSGSDTAYPTYPNNVRRHSRETNHQRSERRQSNESESAYSSHRGRSRERRQNDDTLGVTLSSLRLEEDSGIDEDPALLRANKGGATSGSETDPESLIQDTRNTSDTATTNQREDTVDPLHNVLLNAPDDHQMKNQRTYIWGESVDLVNNKSTELRSYDRIHKVSRKAMSKLIVAFLNTGLPATIYLGIEETGVVTGMQVDRDTRDEFRLGIDDEMRRVQPSGLFSQYDVQFVPVIPAMERDNPRASSVLPNRFVIEISLTPKRDTLYTTGGDCYLRQGPNVVLLSVQDMRRIIVEQEEAEYLLEIESLQLEVERLQREKKKQLEQEVVH